MKLKQKEQKHYRHKTKSLRTKRQKNEKELDILYEVGRNAHHMTHHLNQPQRVSHSYHDSRH